MTHNEPSKFVSAVKRFFSHLVPGMDDIRTHRPILAPIVVAWLFSLASAYSLWPLMASTLPADAVEAVAGIFWAMAVLAPLVILAKAGVLAVVGWAVLMLVNSERRLRPLFSVLLYGEAILATQGVLAAVFVRATSGTPTSPEDLGAAMGLAAFVPASHPVLQSMASGVTLMHIAWYVFLYLAFRRVVEIERLAAGGLAALFWIGLIGLAGARASLL